MKRRKKILLLASCLLGSLFPVTFKMCRDNQQGGKIAFSGASTSAVQQGTGRGRIDNVDATEYRKPPVFTTQMLERENRLSPQEPKAAGVFRVLRGYPQKYYNAEKRDLLWASGMESALSDRFANAGQASGLMSLRAHEIECRESTCRVEFSFSKEDFEAAKAKEGKDPLASLRLATGPFATFSYESNQAATLKLVDPKTAIGDDGSYRKTVILLFDSPDIDPVTYSSYVGEQHRKNLLSRGQKTTAAH